MIVLKNNDGLYIKSFDTAQGKLEFTTNVAEAKDYERGQWFAQMELESIQFYFKDKKDQLQTMHVKIIDEDDINEDEAENLLNENLHGINPPDDEDEAENLAAENPHGMNPPDDAGVGLALL